MIDNISSMIYSKKISNSNPNLYTDDFIEYCIDVCLYGKSFCSESDIVSFMTNIFNDKIKVSVLKNYVLENYPTIKKKKYILPENKREKMEEVLKFKSEVKNNFDSEVELYSKLKISEIIDYESFLENFKKYLLIYFKSNVLTINEVYSLYYKVLLNNENYIKQLSNCLTRIRKTYNLIDLTDVFEFNTINKSILATNNLNNIKDLKSASLYSSLLLLIVGFDKNLEILTFFSNDIETIVNDEFIKIEDKNLEIIKQRNGYFFEDKKTLQEIGTSSDLTRERIRQLEANTYRQINSISQNLKPVILSFYNSEVNKRKKYITIEELLNKYEKEILIKIVLLITNSDFYIKYDDTYKIIYNSNENKIDELVSLKMEEVGIVADYYEVSEADEFVKRIFENDYKKINDNVFLKKGCNSRDLYLDIIEEKFSTGFSVSSDYEELIDIVKDRYKLEELPSKHTVEAMIGRSDFILCDRGTYLLEKYAISIPDELMDEMLNYIQENNFTYYQSLYEKYKKELDLIGINNRYYLKGIIDLKLPENMTSGRDYITNGEQSHTPYDEIVSYFKSFDNEFTFEQIKRQYIGLQNYTIYNILYSEAEKGLVWISSSEFKYIEKYMLDSDTINELKTFIDSLFTQFETDIISAKKIYARLQLTNKSLFEKLGLTNGYFNLFSLIRVLYKDYYFSRPFISINDNQLTSRNQVIKNYVEQLDRFNYHTIQDYQSKMNVGVLFSYLQFMEDMSEDYVQIDIDEMVKKDKINISDITLNELKKMLNLLISTFGEINTTTFNGYSIFPKLNYSWNKYLLAGIVRTFLSDEFEIVNTTNKYTSTDFVIRRFINE